MTAQSDLVERLRSHLSDEPSVRETAMFAGRSFMVNDKLVVSAHKDGGLLVRVDARRHDEMSQEPGASPAVMGAGRSMGRGWISVTGDSITSDERLAFWVDVALEHNRAAAEERAGAATPPTTAARARARRSPG